MGLHDLTGKEQQFQHAYEVSGWGCRISRVRNIRSNMDTRYQVRLQATTGCELQIVHAYYVSGGDFRISRVRNTRSNVHMRCQNGNACYHVLGTKVVHEYKVSGWGCRISRVRQTRSGWGFRISRVRNISDRTCLRGIRVGLQALTGKEQLFQHAYEVSGRVCSISRVGKTDRTCLLGIRRDFRISRVQNTR